jgi:hypothetical protein
VWHDEAMKAHATEEGKTAQDNFTNAMKKLFSVPKAAIQEPKHKPARKKSSRKTHQ